MADHGRVVGNPTRAVIISTRRSTGLTAGVLAELVKEVGPLRQECHPARLAARPLNRAVGADAAPAGAVLSLPDPADTRRCSSCSTPQAQQQPTGQWIRTHET